MISSSTKGTGTARLVMSSSSRGLVQFPVQLIISVFLLAHSLASSSHSAFSTPISLLALMKCGELLSSPPLLINKTLLLYDKEKAIVSW